MWNFLPILSPKIIKVGKFSPSYSKYKGGGRFLQTQCTTYDISLYEYLGTHTPRANSPMVCIVFFSVVGLRIPVPAIQFKVFQKQSVLPLTVKVTFYSALLWNNHPPIRYRHRQSGSTAYRLQASSDYIDKPISRYRSPTTLRCDIVGQIEPTISCKSHPT